MVRPQAAADEASRVWKAMFVPIRVSQESANPSVPASQRDIDRLSFFGHWRLGHAAELGHDFFQAIPSRGDRDDVIETGNLQIDVGVGVGELRRDSNSLAVA
jgi:hypothetical protein